MVKFYELHLKAAMSPSEALRQAQRWLRTARPRELTEVVADSEALRAAVLRLDPDIAPFAHPVFWAAFTMTGAAN
jgi:CHAT domain-containing protein